MVLVHCDIKSPLGPLRAVASDDALCGLYFADHKYPPKRCGGRADDALVLVETAKQLGEYFQGERLAFDLPLSFVGTAFQQNVWNALQKIPFGERTSYRALAERVSSALAVRAVGAANGRNPISIVVPCHRVVGSGGSLTGYAGGESRKRWLLDHEVRVLAARQPFRLTAP